jgi:hypothetical protein
LYATVLHDWFRADPEPILGALRGPAALHLKTGIARGAIRFASGASVKG